MDKTVISIVGDVMFHDRMKDLRQEEDEFDTVLHEFEASDLVIANLEMPLSRRGYRVQKYANIRSDPRIAEEVRALGIDAVSMANNHMMDFGPEAMMDTVAACGQAGLAHSGAGPDIDAAFAPAWLQAGNLRIGMLSASCTVPVESAAGEDKPGTAGVRVGFSFEVDPNLMMEQPGSMPEVRSWTVTEDTERLCTAVRTMKSKADIAIVVMHWGVPTYWLSPSQGLLAQYQQPLAHMLIDAGADLIAGNHPHAINPVEVYAGKPVFYSLGNFIYTDLLDFMRPESLLVRFSPSEGSLQIVPYLVGQLGLPRRAVGEEAKRVLTKLDTMSAPLQTRIRIEGDCGYPAPK